MTSHSSINPQEVTKFSQLAQSWWDKNGPLKTLHDINPVRLAFILKHLTPQKQSVLDLGCGGGILSESLAQAGFCVTGLDASAQSIHEAVQHAMVSGLNINYVCSPVENYDGLFDAITCMEMLEHVDSPVLVLTHAARLLKSGGLLFLSTINRTLKSYLKAILGAEYILSLLPRQTHDYDKLIRPGELARVIRDSGFELSMIMGMDYNPFTRTASLTHDVSVNYLMVCKKL